MQIDFCKRGRKSPFVLKCGYDWAVFLDFWSADIRLELKGSDLFRLFHLDRGKTLNMNCFA